MRMFCSGSQPIFLRTLSEKCLHFVLADSWYIGATLGSSSPNNCNSRIYFSFLSPRIKAPLRTEPAVKESSPQGIPALPAFLLGQATQGRRGGWMCTGLLIALLEELLRFYSY